MNPLRIVIFIIVFFVGVMVNVAGSTMYWLDGVSRVVMFLAGAFVMALSYGWIIGRGLWLKRQWIAGSSAVLLQIVGASIIAIAAQLTIQSGSFGPSMALFGVLLIGSVVLIEGHQWWRSLWRGGKRA